MKKVYLFLANGCEEIEALTAVDILRRGGVEVVTVSITGNAMIDGSHGIRMEADAVLSDSESAVKVGSNESVNLKDADMVVLPGGLKGTNALMAHEAVRDLLFFYRDEERFVTAICAAPSVLGMNGMLKGKKATCYPGFEDKLLGATATGADVTVDGQFITGRGMGVSQKFALALLEALEGKENAKKIHDGICMPK